MCSGTHAGSPVCTQCPCCRCPEGPVLVIQPHLVTKSVWASAHNARAVGVLKDMCW